MKNFFARIKAFLASLNKSGSAISPEEYDLFIEKYAPKKVENVPAHKPQEIELNLDTGKIVLPDNLSPEDRAEVEAAIQDLRDSLQGYNKDQFQSLEQFLQSQSTQHTVPFIVANGLPDGQDQLVEEMQNHKEDTEHYTNDDFMDVILSYHNQGYEFDGFEDMYNRVAQKQELTENDRKKLEQWYMLVSMEMVYDV